MLRPRASFSWKDLGSALAWRSLANRGALSPSAFTLFAAASLQSGEHRFLRVPSCCTGSFMRAGFLSFILCSWDTMISAPSSKGVTQHLALSSSVSFLVVFASLAQEGHC